MKILHVQHLIKIAGSEQYLLKILPELVQRGVEVHFLALISQDIAKPQLRFFDQLEAAGITIHKLPLGKIPAPKTLAPIAALIKNERYDFVHTHLLHADIWVGLARKLYGLKRIPQFSTKHGYSEKYMTPYGLAIHPQKWDTYRIAAQFAEKFIDRSLAISHGIRDLFIGLGISDPDKIEVIHYGFDFDNATQLEGGIDAEAGMRYLLIVGRLEACKGHFLLLEAMAHLRDSGMKNIKLLVVGIGLHEAEIRQKSSELQLDDQVEFLGYRWDVRALMAQADIVAVPSKAEGFGVVLLEAMSVKTPLVAWDVPAPNEIIEDGISGLLATPYDPEAFARKIERLLEDPAYGRALADRAHERLNSYYTLERMTQETMAFYERALG